MPREPLERSQQWKSGELASPPSLRTQRFGRSRHECPHLLVLRHKLVVVGFWFLVTIAAFIGIKPAGDALAQQFDVPGREGFETNRDLAAIYGNGGNVAPLIPVVQLAPGKTVDSPGVSEQLAGALAKVEAALPEARTVSYASTHDRAFVSDDGRTTFALVYIPALGGVDPGKAEARLAQAALAGVTVGGSRVEVTGLDALRAGASDSGGGAGVLLATLAAALGALLILVSSSARSWRSCRC